MLDFPRWRFKNKNRKNQKDTLIKDWFFFFREKNQKYKKLSQGRERNKRNRCELFFFFFFSLLFSSSPYTYYKLVYGQRRWCFLFTEVRDDERRRNWICAVGFRWSSCLGRWRQPRWSDCYREIASYYFLQRFVILQKKKKTIFHLILAGIFISPVVSYFSYGGR